MFTPLLPKGVFCIVWKIRWIVGVAGGVNAVGGINLYLPALIAVVRLFDHVGLGFSALDTGKDRKYNKANL